MCLAAAILPWVVDLLNSLGYTITIRTSSSEEEARARGAALSAAAAPPTAPSASHSSSSSSSATAAEGGGRGASRTGMTAASLQMTTIGPHGQSASEKENDSRHSNNQKASSCETNANMVALSTSSPVDTITPASPTDSNGARSSRTCCFCWCCCCSCSCITVSSGDQSSSYPPSGTKPEDPVPHKVDDLPTQDELKAWGESFDKVMQSTKGREKFREFLRSEYSEENVLFWLACEELKKQTNPETIEERARSIYEDYISILSPKEVSLDSRAREVINKNMVHPSPHTFDDAQLQIYTLMHRDSYPRFLNSNIYKRLLTQ